MAASPIYLGAVKSPMAQILPADASNLVTLWTPGASGSKICVIGVSSTDTSARDVALYVTRASVDYLLGTVQIPVTAGFTNAIPSVDLLGSAMLPWMRTDADGIKYLHLETAAVLKAKVLTTLTAGKAIQFVTHGGDY